MMSQIPTFKFFMILGLVVHMLSLAVAGAEDSPANGLSPSESTQMIRGAAQATELAWEEFHSAAIGGTLASPLTQVTIEQQLHEIRALLMKARIADRGKQFESVKEMTQRIQVMTKHIIQSSRERKQ